VLLITDTWLPLVSLGYIVRMSAKATDPLMVPATATIESSLLVIVPHFFMNLLQMAEIPNMVMILAMTTIPSYSPKKEKEMGFFDKIVDGANP
jgi:hypothetical protein